MDWRFKALAFRALDLPGGERAHYFLQRHVTRNWPRPQAGLALLSATAQRILDDYTKHLGGVPATVLEVGAGRDLAVPSALRRLGVARVIATDVKRLAKLELIEHAAKRRFKSWDDLARFGVDYRAPHMVSAADPKVDCSCSNEVLEHVPPEQLVDLLAALRAVTTGITTHSIDYSDHYARTDPKVSRLNFLRYSDQEWRPFNSGKQYVNRLRHSDYLMLFRQAGFTILEESRVTGDPPPAIAPQFLAYDPLDLHAVKGRIVAR